MSKDLIGGSNQTQARKLFTGLGTVRPIIANPSNEEYEAITGRPLPYTPKYEMLTMENGVYFPINILCETKDGYQFQKFLIGNEPTTSKSGKTKYINRLGAVVWGDSPDALSANSKMEWFTTEPFAPIEGGTELLYNFLKALTSYSGKSEDANWIPDMENLGITNKDLFERNDVSGLNKLLKWANNKDFSVCVLYSVKTVEKEGSSNYYQNLESGTAFKNSMFFRADKDGTVPLYAIEELRKMDKDSSEQGYSLCNRAYSIDFQEFSPITPVPNEPLQDFESAAVV